VAAAIAAAAVATPSAAHAGTWGPVRDATAKGAAFAPTAAADAGGRFTIGFIRQRRGSYRAEIRRGLLARGLSGASLVLDASREDLSSLALTQSADGLLAAAWLRHQDRAQGPRAATVSEDGEVTGPLNLVSDGTESAFDPRWVAPRLLVWDRRTSSASAALQGAAFRAPTPLPGDGLTSEISVVAEPSGARIAVWSDGARVVAATARAGGPFGSAVAISGPGVARDPQLALSADGTAVAAWVRNESSGNVMEVASRAPGGAFGSPVAVSDPGEGAFAPRIIASSAGEVVATWVSGPADRGWGTARGPLRIRRLAGDGEVVGDAVTLTPPGLRTGEAALADDGRGAVLIGWSSGLLSRRQIGVRRLGRHGRLGPVRELAAGRWELTGAPVLAAAAGRAVMVWAADGVVRYRLYG
jgi:hypothetical protein